ncbi:MAG: GMC family oxidoreductase [Candidatus Binatus sp.]
MIVDFRDYADGHVFRADVCIIGSGAAGITIAREFFFSGFSVVTSEGGGFKWEEDTQALYTSEVVGLPHKGVHIGRARVFGGTTTLWAGQTLPLDDIDFRPRPWVADSGWPLVRRDLEPYYRRAEKTLNLSEIDYRDPSFFGVSTALFESRQLRPLISQFSPKANFAAAYGNQLKSLSSITVILHANATQLMANSDASAITGVEIRSLSGRCGAIDAAFYVVCCGGIETPRLLLASNEIERPGLGNRHDRVGRYFQDHVQARLASVRLRDAKRVLESFETFYRKGVAYSPKLALNEEVQEKRGTLNATVGVVRAELPAENTAVDAAKRLASGLRHWNFIKPSAGDLKQLLRSPHDILLAAFRRYVQHKPAFQLSGEPYISLCCECEPNPDSRVLLSDERDALGMRRAKLDWHLTPLVRHTAMVVVEILAKELKRLEIGEVDTASCDVMRNQDWERSFWDINHHIGTCRMSTDPHNGVVDPDCKVHTIDNLFISSSAVFPTGGHSNPTFTMLALAIRLADHLKLRLSRSVPTVSGRADAQR